jgi:hypothetical protein
MSDPQRPEREAMQRCYCGPRECLHPANLQPGYQCAVVLAALPPTPTPGPVKELREWLRDEAEFAHQKGWNDRAETLMDVEAKCDDVGIVLPPAPTGERE